MKLKLITPVRVFDPKSDGKRPVSECARIELEPDQQITLLAESGKRYDFASKDWGYYVTPSINGRLKREGFKTALVANPFNKVFLMVVEEEKIESFLAYCKDTDKRIVEWIDERQLSEA